MLTGNCCHCGNETELERFGQEADCGCQDRDDCDEDENVDAMQRSERLAGG